MAAIGGLNTSSYFLVPGRPMLPSTPRAASKRIRLSYIFCWVLGLAILFWRFQASPFTTAGTARMKSSESASGNTVEMTTPKRIAGDKVRQQHEHIFDCHDLPQEEQIDNEGTTITLHNFNIPEFLMNIHPIDDLVSGDIFKFGCFECIILERAMSALQNAPPDAFLIDIGANLGMYSLHAAAMGRDVYSFEPLRQNWRRLCRSVLMNPGFDERITLFNVALTEQPTMVQFNPLNKKNLGNTSIRHKDETPSATNSHNQNALPAQTSPLAKETVGVEAAYGIPLSSLKDVLPAGNNQPVILKIDVEGYECNVLDGALEYLKTVDLLYVSIEWTPTRLRACRHLENIFDLFSNQQKLVPYQYDLFWKTWKRLDIANWKSWRQHWIIERVLTNDLMDIVWQRE
jgi:FkbM family methyltransferase